MFLTWFDQMLSEQLFAHIDQRILNAMGSPSI